MFTLTNKTGNHAVTLIGDSGKMFIYDPTNLYVLNVIDEATATIINGKGNFAIIKTCGGYHTLLRKECLSFNPNNFLEEVYRQAKNPNFEEYIDEFVANDSSHKSKDGKNTIKRSALIPTPGCRQYDSYPIVMNKEDFE